MCHNEFLLEVLPMMRRDSCNLKMHSSQSGFCTSPTKFKMAYRHPNVQDLGAHVPSPMDEKRQKERQAVVARAQRHQLEARPEARLVGWHGVQRRMDCSVDMPSVPAASLCIPCHASDCAAGQGRP